LFYKLEANMQTKRRIKIEHTFEILKKCKSCINNLYFKFFFGILKEL
jgi:predicted transcriptional regulator